MRDMDGHGKIREKRLWLFLGIIVFLFCVGTFGCSLNDTENVKKTTQIQEAADESELVDEGNGVGANKRESEHGKESPKDKTKQENSQTASEKKKDRQGADQTDSEKKKDRQEADQTDSEKKKDRQEADQTSSERKKDSREPSQTTSNQKKENPSKKEKLQIHFIDVGQGDATLITLGGHAMLIDAGNNQSGSVVQSYLSYHGITSLDYLIGTHPDSDHIGGLDVILYHFDCSKVLMEKSDKDTKTYEDVLVSLQARDMKNVMPQAGQTYVFGDASFTVVAPVGQEYSSDNSRSIGILLTYGDTSFLFTGDAEEEAEEDMLAKWGKRLKADVFKAAHHGSDTANTEDFLAAVSPEYVVISCGEGNSYGHPHAQVLNTLRSKGIQVFRTDEQGTVVATSNGKSITFNMSPSTSWQAGERTGSSQVSSHAEASKEQSQVTLQSNKERKTEYIVNTNTKKYHLPSCRYVKQILSENARKLVGTKWELEELGYDGCGWCIN